MRSKLTRYAVTITAVAVAVVALAVVMNVTLFNRAAAPGVAAPAQAGNVSNQGITVYGRWTVQVKNPDGAVVQQRKFENDLTLNGQEHLVKVLTSQESAGVWAVSLRDNNNAGPCQQDDGSPVNCVTVDPSSGLASLNEPYIFPNLQVSAKSSQNNQYDDTIVLTGHVDAAADGSISRVATPYSSCSSSVAPADCTSRSTNDFTQHQLSTPLTVMQGQRIAVRVEISFQSASAQ